MKEEDLEIGKLYIYIGKEKDDWHRKRVAYTFTEREPLYKFGCSYHFKNTKSGYYTTVYHSELKDWAEYQLEIK